MNKNIIVGGGLIVAGIFLAYRAKKKGKVVFGDKRYNKGYERLRHLCYS